MKKPLAAVSLVAAALFLSGCGSPSPAAAPSAPTVAPAASASASAVPTPTASASPRNMSIRGNLVKGVGEAASVTYQNDTDTIASFVAKSIEIAPACPAQYAPKAKNGQVVIMTFDIQTTQKLAETPGKSWGLNIFGWKAIAGNGTTVNGNPVMFGCLDSADELPTSLGPNEKATGKLAFDVPPGNGSLVFAFPGMASGWEWNYPAK